MSRTFAYTSRFDNGIDFDSSSLDKVYYNSDTNVLGVEFQTNDTIYGYRSVPESVFNLFVGSDSVGGFYVDHIKDRFDGDGIYTIGLPVEDEEEPLADWERELLANEPVEVEVDPSNVISFPSVNLGFENAFAKYDVKWTGSFNSSDERMGPFMFSTRAINETDAVSNFFATARALHGAAVSARIVSVTRYFE